MFCFFKLFQQNNISLPLIVYEIKYNDESSACDVNYHYELVIEGVVL